MRNKATPSAAKAKADRERDATARRFVQRIKVAHKAGDETRVLNLSKEANKQGVSKAVVERALDRIRNRGQLEEILYEGTGPGGVCFLVEALTDKKTRTAPEVRHALSEGGGSLGAPGAAMWAFERKGVLDFEPASEAERDALIDHAMSLDGVEDIDDAPAPEAADGDGGGVVGVRVRVAAADLSTLREALAPTYTLVGEQLQFAPLHALELEDPEAQTAHDMTVDALRALDDVEAVWTNVAEV